MRNRLDAILRNAAFLAAVFAVAALLARPAAAEPVTSGTSPAPVTKAEVAQAESDANDPIEGFNRAIFEFNEFFYTYVLRPVAEVYVAVLPDEARNGIRNFLTNLRTPIVLANDVLQGEGERAWITTERFLINSTVGLGGLIDVAKEWGIQGHNEDLGQTFAVWGAPEGFYLVLPILGPSNPRDAAGKFLDSFLDPLSYYLTNTDREEYDIGRSALLGVDEFSRVMDDLRKLKDTSVDYYAALRSISRQKRAAEIRNGEVGGNSPLPDLKYDFNTKYDFKAELTPR